MPSDGEPILGSGLNRSESRRGEAPRWLAGGRKRMEDSQRITRACHPQAAISPPTSFQSRQRGPTWTSRRPTSQANPDHDGDSDPCAQLHSSTSVSVVGARIFSVTIIAKCVARSAWGRFGQAASSAGRRNTRGRSKVRGALTEPQPSWPHLAAMLDDMRR